MAKKKVVKKVRKKRVGSGRSGGKPVVRKKKRLRKKKLTPFQKFKRNKPMLYGSIAVVILVLLFVFKKVDESLDMASVAPQKNEEPEINSNTIERIDQHMKNAAIQRQLKEQKMRLENRDQAPRPGSAADLNLFPEPVHPYGVETRTDTSLEKINNDIGSETHALDMKLNPEERVAAKLERERFVDEYNKVSQQAYVDEFIANAAKDGWEVEVNDKMEITNVRKKKPKRLNIQ